MIKKFTQYITEKVNYASFKKAMSSKKVTIEVGLNDLKRVVPNFTCLIFILADDSVIEYVDDKLMKIYNSLEDYIQKTYIGNQEDETLFDFYRGVFTSEETQDGDVTYTDVTNRTMYKQIAQNSEFPIIRIYEVIEEDNAAHDGDDPDDWDNGE